MKFSSPSFLLLLCIGINFFFFANGNENKKIEHKVHLEDHSDISTPDPIRLGKDEARDIAMRMGLVKPTPTKYPIFADRDEAAEWREPGRYDVPLPGGFQEPVEPDYEAMIKQAVADGYNPGFIANSLERPPEDPLEDIYTEQDEIDQWMEMEKAAKKEKKAKKKSKGGGWPPEQFLKQPQDYDPNEFHESDIEYREGDLPLNFESDQVYYLIIDGRLYKQYYDKALEMASFRELTRYYIPQMYGARIYRLTENAKGSPPKFGRDDKMLYVIENDKLFRRILIESKYFGLKKTYTFINVMYFYTDENDDLDQEYGVGPTIRPDLVEYTDYSDFLYDEEFQEELNRQIMYMLVDGKLYQQTLVTDQETGTKYAVLKQLTWYVVPQMYQQTMYKLQYHLKGNHPFKFKPLDKFSYSFKSYKNKPVLMKNLVDKRFLRKDKLSFQPMQLQINDDALFMNRDPDRKYADDVLLIPCPVTPLTLDTKTGEYFHLKPDKKGPQPEEKIYEVPEDLLGGDEPEYEFPSDPKLGSIAPVRLPEAPRPEMPPVPIDGWPNVPFGQKGQGSQGTTYAANGEPMTLV